MLPKTPLPTRKGGGAVSLLALDLFLVGAVCVAVAPHWRDSAGWQDISKDVRLWQVTPAAASV